MSYLTLEESFTYTGNKKELLTLVPGRFFNRMRELLMDVDDNDEYTVIYDGDSLVII